MLAYKCKAIVTMTETKTLIDYVHNNGFDGFETDVRLTSDGIYVLRHTGTVSDGTNTYDIASNTYADLLLYSSDLLTLAEGLALQKQYDLIAVYESKLSDSEHATAILDMIAESGVDIRKTYIEPTNFSGTSYFTNYNRNINVILKGGELSESGLAEAAAYLTGFNHVGFTINQTHLQSFTDDYVTLMKEKGLELIADPVTRGVIEIYSQFSFNQIWGSQGAMGVALVEMRDNYSDKNVPAYSLSDTFVDIADALRTVSNTNGKLSPLEFANAIKHLKYAE